MDWVTVKCTVRTPLFTAGWSGRGQSILGSSVRGVLGFWLRAVVGSRVGNDLESLARWQRRVLGSTERQSPTVVRVISPSLGTQRRECLWPKGIVYLLGQGLFESAQNPRDGRPGRPATVRPYLDPESDRENGFTLRFRLPEDDNAAELFWAALWCATNFGGLGARTRRGFGRFTVDIKDDAAPSWWADPAAIRPEAGRPGWIGLPQPIRAVVDRVVEPVTDEQWLTEVPLYPRFDHRDDPADDWFSAIADRPDPPKSKWRPCLNTLGLKWQEYRRPIPYNVKGSKYEYRRTPEWRDTVDPAIRTLTEPWASSSSAPWVCQWYSPTRTRGRR